MSMKVIESDFVTALDYSQLHSLSFIRMDRNMLLYNIYKMEGNCFEFAVYESKRTAFVINSFETVHNELFPFSESLAHKPLSENKVWTSAHFFMGIKPRAWAAQTAPVFNDHTIPASNLPTGSLPP